MQSLQEIQIVYNMPVHKTNINSIIIAYKQQHTQTHQWNCQQTDLDSNIMLFKWNEYADCVRAQLYNVMPTFMVK